MYDGNPKNLDAFLDSVALFVEIVNNENAVASQAAKDAANATTLRFIKMRLTETARQSIPGNANLDQLIDALKTNCSSKTTAENVLAKGFLYLSGKAHTRAEVHLHTKQNTG